MASFFDMLKMLIMCSTLFGVAWVVALSMPKSQARTVLTEIVSWAFMAFMACYALSPIDLLPEGMLGPVGLLDDFGAVFMGYQSYKSAMQAREERQYLD